MFRISCSNFITQINYPAIFALGHFDTLPTGSSHGGYTNVLAWEIEE